MDPTAAASPVARLVDLIVGEALTAEAAQIHLDAAGVVRFLRGESWLQVMKLPPPISSMVLNRLRVVASLDRTKGKQRQEREVKLHVRDHDHHVHISVQYTEDGTEELYVHLCGE